MNVNEHKAPRKFGAYSLIGILFISVIGTVSVPISAEENIFQKDTYITQFGPGFAEIEIASSADNCPKI